MGNIDILSTGRGHLKLEITEGNAVEIEKARRIIEDMIHRGYAIFVEDAKGLHRVRRFNPKKMTYVIDDTMETTPAAPEPAKRAGRGRKTREVPATTARATAVGRTAGG